MDSPATPTPPQPVPCQPVSAMPELPWHYAFSHEPTPRRLWDEDDMRAFAEAATAQSRAALAQCEEKLAKATTPALVAERWNKEAPPNARKKIEVAVLLRATTKEIAAAELEALADRLRQEGRDGFVGYVGHAASHHASSAYAAADLSAPSGSGKGTQL